MKLKSTLLASTFFSLFAIHSASAQTAGDYRSNGTGDWTNPATWQTFTTVWGPASTAPDATSGLITIRTGDSVTLASTLTIDQVVVQSGAMLAMGGSNTITLNNAPAGSAIANSGKVYVKASGVLSGGGTFLNSPGALLKIELSSTLAVNTTNNGEVRFSTTSAVKTATLTNNNIVQWLDASLFLLTGGTIVNNDSIAILVNTAVNLTTDATGTLNNSSGSVIYFADPALNLTVSPGIAFSNSGTVRGLGQADFPNTSVNTGIITPGNGSSGTLTLGPVFPSTGSPSYQLGVGSTGAVAGTNYSTMAFTSGINISASTLTVTDDPSLADPIGTVYTLFTAASGSFTGNFSTVNLSPSLGTLTVNPASITVSRIGTLPLTWGSFRVTAAGSQALLSWTTLQESNTKDFTVERSANGSSFSAIGTVAAKGNSSVLSSYSFTDIAPFQQGFNYYRLTQTDLDGKKSYSIITVISFGKEKTVVVQTSPNPVQDLLNITVQQDNVTILVTDMSGRTMKVLRLAPGFHQTSVSDLAKGVYQLTILQGQNKIDSRQIIKF